MPDTLTLFLPLSPSVNNTYSITCNRSTPIKSVKAAGKEYFKTVLQYVKTNNFDIQANIPLKVTLLISFKTKHRNDIDNRVKSLLDALTQAQVWEDDSLINELHIIRQPVSKTGSILVHIEEYQQQ